MWRLRSSVFLLALGLLTPITPAFAEPLDEVTKQREVLEEDVEQLLTELESVRARLEETETELQALSDQRGRLMSEAEDSQRVLRERVRQHAMQPDQTLLSVAMTPDGFGAALEGATKLAIVHSREHEDFERSQAAVTRLSAVEERLADRRRELADLEQQHARRSAELQQRLEDTRLRERRLRAQQASRQRVDRGPQQGMYACIFDQGVSSFIDSWGFPRSGGRSHQGADVMAPRAAKVYAFTDGTIGRMTTGGLGGVSLRLQGDDGNRYYYAHLQEFADGVRSGMRVRAGQMIGLNGNSGNARGGPTHVHFQMHPGGGGPTNPYPWLRAVCR